MFVDSSSIYTLHCIGPRYDSPPPQSLIVRYRCKLELWDEGEGLERGAAPDLVIDRTSRTNLGRNKYVDSLKDEDEYKHMDEKISAYR